MKTIAEFVLPGHPDKLCDRIADTLVDEACRRDPLSLVGVEVALHQQKVFITGCVTTIPALTETEIVSIVRRCFCEAGYGDQWSPHPSDIQVEMDVRLELLDDDLRHLRTIADDQAICIGYAGGRKTDRYLPRAHRLAYLAGQKMKDRRAIYNLGPDGKVIVTCNDEEVERVSLSLHHKSDVDKRDLFRLAQDVGHCIGLEDLSKISVNGGGDFDVGGPWGDNGLSGKKLVMDAYGPTIPIGGGAWSGKDPHKIDRSGGLIARYLAVRAVRMGLGSEAIIRLGWHPGDSQPSVRVLMVDGYERSWKLLGVQEISLAGIWSRLRLGTIRFASYADGSWFQRSAPWDIQQVVIEEETERTVDS